MVLPTSAADSPAAGGDALCSLSPWSGLGKPEHKNLKRLGVSENAPGDFPPGGSCLPLAFLGARGLRAEGLRGLLPPRRFPGLWASPARSPRASCRSFSPNQRESHPGPSPAPHCPLVKPQSSAWHPRPLIPARLHPLRLHRPGPGPGWPRSRCVCTNLPSRPILRSRTRRITCSGAPDEPRSHSPCISPQLLPREGDSRGPLQLRGPVTCSHHWGRSKREPEKGWSSPRSRTPGQPCRSLG